MSKFTGTSNLDYKSIESVLSQKTESSHFNYYLSPNDKVDTLQLESFYRWAKKELLIKSEEKIHYYKYQNLQQMKDLTGRTSNAFAESSLKEKVIHSIHPRDNHEITHVLLKGFAPVFFGEGLAVSHQTKPEINDLTIRYNGVEIDSLVLLHLDNLPDLNDLLQLNSFRKMDNNLSYPLAASFLKYLKERYSIVKIKRFCEISRFDDSIAKMKNDFKNVFKSDLDKNWDDYISYMKQIKSD